MQIIQTDNADVSVGNRNKFVDKENTRQVSQDILGDDNISGSRNLVDKEFISSNNDGIKRNLYRYSSIPFDITATVHKREINPNVPETLFESIFEGSQYNSTLLSRINN